MNKIFRCIAFSLICCVVFIIGCAKGVSTRSADIIKALTFADIKSAKIELARTGGSPINNYIFDFNNSEQTKIIKDIIRYLNSGKVQGNADEKVTSKGGSPNFLIVELKDSSVIKIKSAVGGKVTKLKDGSTEISQFDIPNEVTINTNSNESPIRILSPELKKLIDSGYKDTFKEKSVLNNDTSQIESNPDSLLSLSIVVPKNWNLDTSEKFRYKFIDEKSENRGSVDAIAYKDNFDLITQMPNHSVVNNDEYIGIPLGKCRLITLDADNGTAASGITGTHDVYYAEVIIPGKAIYMLDFTENDKKLETKNQFIEILNKLSLK